MKKRIALILMIVVALCTCMDVSAQSKKSSSKSRSSSSSKSSKFPITITAEMLQNYGSFTKLPLDTQLKPQDSYSKLKYVITMKGDGTYTATIFTANRTWRTDYQWRDYDPVEFSGVWVTTSRRMGTSNQLVYDLRMKDGESLYIPASFDYVYEKNWDDCRNANTSPSWVIPITSVKR